ncbi:hypothetical protein VDG1235_3363 [Verrucomicrobiia bacterium DG1235]|nr:hypothetical protein VDG1235_3363 [Verrucomicrobiae bacterium DG1235]
MGGFLRNLVQVMSEFEDIFSEEIDGLERAISEVPSERKHIRRCMELVGVVEWDGSNAGNEIGALLGRRGCRLFDEMTRRIASALEGEAAAELQDAGQFLHWLMLVHDIGKYDLETQSYNGSGHEERSGDYVLRKCRDLQAELHWERGNAELLVHLTRFHSQLGIARLGEVSNVFLEPILAALLNLDSKRKRLFLDFLVVMTCCDAGASGNFETNAFYLDESRITLYGQVADELFAIAEKFGPQEHAAAAKALVAHASSTINTTKRIKRMVTSENLMDAAERDIELALGVVVSGGLFDLKRFALTQFDHGAYVFAPLLMRLSGEAESLSVNLLQKFLVFLGVLCAASEGKRVIQFRRSFSMKADLQAANGNRFEALVEAVKSGDPRLIGELVTSGEE